MALVASYLLPDSSPVSGLVSATQNSLLEGFATPECANSYFPKLLVQDFCQQYESLVSAM